jgi:archaeal flagellar protein FlaJ
MVHIYRKIAGLIPKPIKKPILQTLKYSSIDINHNSLIGFVMISSLLIAIIAGFFLSYFFDKPFWVFFTLFLFLTNIVIYLYLLLQIDAKARIINDSLPDALQLMSSSLNAGMTPDKALLLSARPEFGPLKTEIDIVGKEVTLGKNIGTALMEMTTRVKSKRLIRAIELINSGLDSGGSLSTLLQATSNDLREQLLVDKKIKANITMYTIFIFSAAAIIIPTLFGLSSYLVEVLQTTLSTIDIPSSSTTSLPINIGGIEITTEFLSMYIVVFIVVNSLMASMILGLIEKGKHIAGFRFFIPMVAMAIPIFFIVKYAIKSGLGGLFGM